MSVDRSLLWTTTGAAQQDEQLRAALLRLAPGSPEQRAIDAGEIDAVIDYADNNVLLFPSARSALSAVAARQPAVDRVANDLLAALTVSEYLRLAPFLEPVTLASGKVLHEPGDPIDHVYFPVDCLISLLAMPTARWTVEVGLVGFDGMVGASLALGVNVAAQRAQVQIGGTALRMPQARFTNELERSRTLQHRFDQYVHAELSAARQAVVCSTLHVIEQRFATWLLRASARVRSDRFYVIQATIAGALGTRRFSITHAASKLQKRGLISYKRGNLRILDRQGLEAASCHCAERLGSLNCGA